MIAYNTDDSGRYQITEPFELRKVASTLRNLCKQNQTKDTYGNTYIKFSGTNKDGETISEIFSVRRIINAFECVGRNAVGIICKNDAVFNGAPFVLVVSESLTEGINALVLKEGK